MIQFPAPFTRRTAMLGGVALSALPLARLSAQQRTPSPLDATADRLLPLFPETATYNGVPGSTDGGPLSRRMDDWSPAGEQARRSALAAEAQRLAAVRIGDPVLARQAAIVSALLENGVRSSGVSYGRINPFWFSGHVPYLITPVAGPHIDTVNLLDSQQPANSAAAVDAWIARLDDFGRGFDGVIAKLRADEAAGCRPPRVLLEKSLPVIDRFLAGPAREHTLMRSLDKRMTDAGLSPRVRAAALKRARTALERRARPAFARLRKQVADMVPRGRAEDGVWAQPDGEALYAANVRALGDTTMSAAEVHQVGLDEVKRITAEMDRLLTARGLTKGSVGARMVELGKDPTQLFADSDAGRAECLAYVERIVRAAEARYPEIVPPALVPRAKLVVKRVPVASQDGAPGGYYDSPSLDGMRPGTYWINLVDMAAVPKFALPTLSYHEGVPGHHLQGAVAAAQGEAPVLVRIASFNAYQEGWALYSEALMAELGAYADDPAGDLGRLQDELFRAVRLVVDTGMHQLRWSRERAIEYMAAATGNPLSSVTSEIERYMAWPGQALGYKLGMIRIQAIRERMKKARRDRFDLKAFHAGVLEGGAMPMALLEARLFS
ncbi:DUF885 domain-containing protein [Sphingomonas gilva]|uniref:DUF885 domain-containing protein n=1 Tax=Sphingomonas gilva TaxID=2305907 RepID=A0A396RLN1_9SPHN|nr:DUF885 domain-containing protein [Sphingomonas gilva]RHW17240.1 DUF885 domain-containing protein [Sphingomonas gilva]